MREDKSDPFTYGLVFQLVCAILVFLFAFWRGFVMPPVKELGFNLFLEAILYAGSIIFLFKALKLMEASEVTILTATSALWTIVFSLLFLDESFSVTKLIGVIIVLGSVVFVTQKEMRLSFHFNQGSLYALLAAFCFGVAFVNDAYILKRSDAISYTAIAFFLPSLVILLIKPATISKIHIFLKPVLIVKMGLLGVFYSTSAITIYLSYQAGGNASQLAPIGLSRIVLTVVLAALVLNERAHLRKKIVAAVLVSIGILLFR